MTFVINNCKTGKCWNQNFFENLQNFVKFDSNDLICDPTLFPGKNSRNIAKSNHIFPGKGKGDRAWILTYFDSLMAEIFPHNCLFFSISVIFREKRVVKVGPIVPTLDPSLFQKSLNPSIFFQTMFLFARVLPMVRISAILEYGPKNLPKRVISWVCNFAKISTPP